MSHVNFDNEYEAVDFYTAARLKILDLFLIFSQQQWQKWRACASFLELAPKQITAIDVHTQSKIFKANSC